jgi:hypothetical protein
MTQPRKRSFLSVFALLGLFSLLVVTPLAPAQKKGKQPIDYNATKMTSAQKIASAKKLLANMKRIRNLIDSRLKEARAKQDLVAVEGFGEILTAVKALLFISERSNTALKNAILKNNGPKSISAYVTIARNEERCRAYETQANLIVGKDGSLKPSGGPVVVILPPNVDSADPTIPIWKEPIVVRLVDASNFY